MLADTARKNFFRPGGDHLTLLNVYNEVHSSPLMWNTVRRSAYIHTVSAIHSVHTIDALLLRLIRRATYCSYLLSVVIVLL